jgi:hypothetical protein
MRLDPVRRVRYPSQSPQKKRANRRRFVSSCVLRVFPSPDRFLSSPWLCASLLLVCAIIRRFFSSRTICEFREILSLGSHFTARPVDGRVVLLPKTKRSFYEDQSPIVGICSSYALVSAGVRRNRQHLLRRVCLLRWRQLLLIK